MNESPWKLDGAAATLAAGEFTAQVAVDQPGRGVHDIAWAGKPIEMARSWLALREASPRPWERIGEIEDVYIRGRDLVAVYAETEAHPLRYIVYWRALEEDQLRGAAAGVDVVVSVQTSVLDIKSTAYVSSQFGVDEAWASAPPDRQWRQIAAETRRERPGDRHDRDELLAAAQQRIASATASRDDTFLFHLAGGMWSCGEMIHPRDRMTSYADVFQFPGVPPLGMNPADWNSDGEMLRAATSNHSILGLRMEKGVLLRARLRAVLARRENAKEVVAACREAFEHAELPLTT